MTTHSISKTQQEIENIRDNRKTSYGTPENNFQSIANYWNEYLYQRNSQEALTPLDVARMMSLLKFGRMFGGVDKHDNYVDAANYLIIAGDIFENNQQKELDYGKENDKEKEDYTSGDTRTWECSVCKGEHQYGEICYHLRGVR